VPAPRERDTAGELRALRTVALIDAVVRSSMVSRSLFAMVLCASACSHDQPVAAPSNHAPSPDVVAASNDPVGFLPVDAEVVVALDIPKIAQSPLWKEYSPMVMGRLPEAAKMLMEQCALTPTTIAVSLKSVSDDALPDGVAVVHGLDKARTLGDCLAKAKQLATQHGHTITLDNDVVTATTKHGAFVGTFATDTTFVAVWGQHADKNALQQAVSSGVGLRKSQGFTALLGKVNTGRPVWLIGNGSSKLFAPAAALGVKPRGIAASIDVSNGVAFDGRVGVESPDQATQLSTMLKAQAGMAASFFDKLDIGTDAADVTLSVELSLEKLKTMMQMMGGGGSP
jgi:hypothetical protein